MSSSVQTVCLDVGGTKYKVARATIEKYPDTMLARLVSDTWQRDNSEEKAIFIDRDCQRFRYVLDYMRDQEVNLPSSISKKALLKDLEYFGFLNVREDGITNVGETHEAAKHLIKCAKNIKELRQLADFTEIAHHCFLQYIQTENQGSEVLVHWPPEYQRRRLEQARQTAAANFDSFSNPFGGYCHQQRRQNDTMADILGGNRSYPSPFGGAGSHQQQVIEGEELVVLQKCLADYGLRHISNNDGGVTVGPLQGTL